MIDMDAWHQMNKYLTTTLGICDCQKRIMSIVKSLAAIKGKILRRELKFSANEVLIVAFLDAKGLLTHGTNIEYPILDESNEFWVWIDKIKNDPNLEDN